MAQRAIHQLVHTLSYGDAISTEVLALQRALRAHGVESEVFALNEHPLLRGKSRSIQSLNDLSESDIILHYSLGSPLNDVYRNWSRGRRALVYHNITPPSWYRSVNARVADDIENGLAELPALCACSDQLIADSPFNSAELSNLGFTAEVLDLPVDPGRWELPRNEGIYSLVKSDPSLHLLHVGRLAPNKCVEDVIKVFYFLHHYILSKGIHPNLPKRGKLWLVGIDTDTELYSFSLRRLALELQLEEQVEFVGCMADEEVRALYESCSSYLCMSEHEGFCLPIIESMHFGLPVVAYGAGAVPHTVGTGGIVFSEKRHAEIAELIAEIAANAELRGRVVQAGKDRVRDFSYDRFEKRVGEVFLTKRAEPVRALG
jgi:glycosyltransferase involved in cell wall biosynthesis